ncbi:FUSC family protein [Pseudoduganella sp. FT25W]|uniref:FUSC family protein n=1 Tax=Duganella alba TaxID=2666081 RepID=A0A6L5QLT1_9BURK|nr:FUSC family protein [Duganella alba]MRX10784.1 FUSC family protein [Duganella alba]MRX18903.1 FUSC family protein [Duganella alba]
MTMPTMPKGSEMLFSAKCFGASMLALYISLAAGLPRPFWAMMTAYIIASPFSGAVRSKALFRVCGTLIGSTMTIFLVPRLANAPELLSLALACWVGVCLYVSLLDRTPRSYIFMLAGYTAGLIGFPAVTDPSAIFDTGLARVEEITIGILSATVVHSLVFPQGVGPVLLGRLDRAIADAQRWMRDVLQPGADKAQAVHTRLALAGEISEMRVMSTHLPFDTSHLRWTAGMVHGLHDRLSVMVPLLLAVEDRLNTLREVDPASLAPWARLLDDTAAWVQAGRDADPARAAQLRAELAQLKPALAVNASWSEILRLNLAQRLDALIEACEDGLELRSNVDAVTRGGASAYAPHLKPSVLHRDHGMALRSALAAVITILLCCAFWILTAWPAGAAAPMMAGVLCCFFATQDDPAPAILAFLKWTLISMPVGAFYILCVLPAVHSYEMLVLSIAPVFLIGGAFMPRPATAGSALAFLIGMAGTLSLQDTGTLDIPTFLNSMVAQVFGYIAAAVITTLIRTVGGDWMAQRMLRTARREVAQMAQATAREPLLKISARMVDRIGLLMPRLAIAHPTPEARAVAVDGLRELRVGLHVAQLCGLQQSLEQAGVTLQPLMQKLGRYFGSGGHAHGQAPAALLERLDGTLRAVCAASTDAAAEARPQAAAALASMRRDLFPRAAAYQPEIAS